MFNRLSNWFKTLPFVWRFTQPWVTLPEGLTEHWSKPKYPDEYKHAVVYRGGHYFGFRLKPEIKEWCRDNNVKCSSIMPSWYMSHDTYGPLIIKFRKPQHSVLFKMWWF